ncbi:MAG: hypothetical protein ACD_58C00096G0001 [uncultured bacterium]|nr:MAG: hypothetical protein ACD_58C00096G0001 [uncultured bacterium]
MILAINTGSNINSIALYSTSVSDEVVWESYHTQSQELLPKIDKLLKSSKVDLSNLKAIAVFQGPGSYTGLRVGVSVANALSWSLNIPVIGIKQNQKSLLSRARVKGKTNSNNVNLVIQNQLTNRQINQSTALKIAKRAHEIIKRKKGTTKYKLVEPIYYNLISDIPML